MQAADLLAQHGVEATVLRLTKLTDFSIEDILQSISKNKQIVVLEEVASPCGICSELASKLSDYNVGGISLGDQYVTHGAVDVLYDHYGLSPEAIKKYVLEVHQK